MKAFFSSSIYLVRARIPIELFKDQHEADTPTASEMNYIDFGLGILRKESFNLFENEFLSIFLQYLVLFYSHLELADHLLLPIEH